jgi:glutamate synthase (NADPH/NADH) large chain
MTLPLPHQRFGLVPAAVGLYNPAEEKDSCGFAMVATLRGTPGHDIIDVALSSLRNLEHRGAVGSDAGTGDGAGIMTQIPDEFLRAVVEFELPVAGHYAVGNVFLPTDERDRLAVKATIETISHEEGLDVLGWRSVPTAPEVLGDLARAARGVLPPCHRATRPADTGAR